MNRLIETGYDYGYDELKTKMDYYDFERGIASFRKLCVNPK